MYAQVEKSNKENKCRAVANSVAQKKSNGNQGYGFVDNRPEAIAQMKLQKQINGETNPIQMINLYRRGNRTPMNFTPRAPQDLQGNARGLSVNSAPGAGIQQVIDSTALENLNAVATPTHAHPDHYSIRPENDETLTEWAQTRAGLADNNVWGNQAIHALTRAVNDARTGQQG